MSSAGQQLVAGRIPGERIASMTPRTSNSGSITTTETLVDSVTAALVSGRRYKVTWTVAVDSSVAGDTAFVRLREDNDAGAQLNILRPHIPATGGSGTRYPSTIEVHYTAVATGNKTFAGTVTRASGTGNITVEAAATYPVEMYVDYVSG